MAFQPTLGRKDPVPDGQRKGSQMRCLQMTSGDRTQIAASLGALIDGLGEVTPSDLWAPRGFQEPAEIRLDEAQGFIRSAAQRAQLKDWWIAPGLMKVRTPVWDLVSTCHLDGAPGLLLVEAKAHVSELNSDPCTAAEKRNIAQMRAALDEATEKWNDLLGAFADARGYKPRTWFDLTPTCHFELGCRLAFALKIAEMGIPVALVYLGFLDADELEDQNCIVFRSEEQWRHFVLEKTKKPAPEELWDETFDVGGTPLSVLIRSASVELG